MESPQQKFIKLKFNSVLTKLLLTGFAVIFSFTITLGQNIPADSTKIPRCYWLAIAVGNSSLESGTFAGNINAELSNGWFITANAQGESNTFINLSSAPTINLFTYNILGGKMIKQHIAFFAASAGLGIANTQTTTTGGLFSTAPTVKTNQTSVNFPVIIQEYIVLGQVFGLGVSGYANINTIHTTVGLTLNLTFGRLATHRP